MQRGLSVGKNQPQGTLSAEITQKSTGQPEEPGNYIAVYDYDNDGELTTEEMYWNSHGWILYRMPLPEECTVYFWTEVPGIPKTAKNEVKG